MNFNKFHLLAGTVVSLTLATTLATPANANQLESSTEVVAARNDDYTGEAVVGTIRSIAGNVVTVQFADGTTGRYWLSRADIQRWSLVEGTDVLIADDTIVGVSRGIVVAESTYRSRTAELWRELETTSTTPTRTEPTRSVTIEQTPTTTTYPEVQQRPVRALW
jgi:hypothetical protein